MSNHAYEDAALRLNQKTEESRLLDLKVPKHQLIAGGAAGDLAVTGITVNDEIVEVLQYVGAGVSVTNIVDLTAEFTPGLGVINNAAGTASTGSKLMVRWNQKTFV